MKNLNYYELVTKQLDKIQLQNNLFNTLLEVSN